MPSLSRLPVCCFVPASCCDLLFTRRLTTKLAATVSEKLPQYSASGNISTSSVCRRNPTSLSLSPVSPDPS
ncbi:hypothetical protein ILYODFUR_008523 [Ilyodon furcidens]|uniref:Secreted protein n=1 Tax=Ilyodon furcidens TaxID=33524 RepID=A0ABV0TT11_9TELE